MVDDVVASLEQAERRFLPLRRVGEPAEVGRRGQVLDVHRNPGLDVLGPRLVPGLELVDESRVHATDEAHLAFALAENRVLYTNDEDYLALHDRGTAHAGIAYCHQQSRSTGDLIRWRYTARE